MMSQGRHSLPALAHPQLAIAARSRARFVTSPHIRVLAPSSTLWTCAISYLPPLFISSPDTHLAYMRISIGVNAARCGQGRGSWRCKCNPSPRVATLTHLLSEAGQRMLRFLLQFLCFFVEGGIDTSSPFVSRSRISCYFCVIVGALYVASPPSIHSPVERFESRTFLPMPAATRVSGYRAVSALARKQVLFSRSKAA
jgi:hypothetical protein